MCGIAGIISRDPSLSSFHRLKRMTDALSHRGPDGEGAWSNQENNVLLGHRRLSIIDLSDQASQPMQFPFDTTATKLSVIHNGEIYNYIELREELRSIGHYFHTQSDTEVILAAYNQWKEDCVLHFDGMFAFAIWDEEERELFAARDRFGEKPFFYYADNEQFLFASEMKALWAGGIERGPNLKMLFNYLTIGYTDNPDKPDETFFNDIKKLPPACRLFYSAIEKEVYIEKYWEIDVSRLDKTISDNDAIEKFTHLLTSSVKKRLRSDVALGTSLSGGIDSSSILAISSVLNASSDTHKCFTAIFPGFEKDESQYSAKVAAKFNSEQFTVSPGAASLSDELETLFFHQEEPFNSASIYAQFKVYQLANQQGVKVLLDGQGADETLAGYHKYYKWYWQELFRKRKLSASHELDDAKKLGIKEHFGWKNRLAAIFPEAASVFLEKHYLLNAIRNEHLDKEFIRQQSNDAYYATPSLTSLNGVLYFNTFEHGLEELLRYADRNSMAHGREVRLPFLNHELIEFVFSLSPGFKIRNGRTKWILRKAMENKLLPEIIWRIDKTGFEPPQKKWMDDKNIRERIQRAKEKLVAEKILSRAVINNKITPTGAYDAKNADWQFLISSFLFK